MTVVVIGIIVALFVVLLIGSYSSYNEDKRIKPQPIKRLTKEQIKEIHSRGKVTPAEKLEEWKEMGVCAPGEEIANIEKRCEKFNYCCRDCLIDYANQKDEYNSSAF